MLSKRSINEKNLVSKPCFALVVLLWFFCSSFGVVYAQSTESTSFEGLRGGDFLIGTAPLSAAFTGGNPGSRGVPSFYRTGSFAWHIDGQTSAQVLFTTPASEVDFWFRDTPNGGPLLVRVIDVDGVVISETTGTQVFENVVVSRTEGQTLIDRIEFENPGLSDSAVDDFEFTAEVPPIDPADIPEPVVGPITESIGAGTIAVSFEEVANGFSAPVVTLNNPIDSTTLYIADQSGLISSVNQESGRITTFLDVSDSLVSLGAFGPLSFDERGLLGFAFHPDYASNGLVYTYTSEPVTDAPDFSTQPLGTVADHQSVISEWRVTNSSDPATAVDRTTRRDLLRLDQPQFNHNAGALVFDADAMLYIALGDGGGADDADGEGFLDGVFVGHGEGNARNTANPYGSILRIDPLGNSSANGQYGIPTDNPFFGVEGVVSEIYAYGFRNPYRMSFDSVTGDLWVADVGQNFIEEINLVVSGGNYGWNQKEGSFFLQTNGSDTSTVTTVDPGGLPDLIDPVAEYDRDEGLAIIGGFVYRGIQIPELVGRYVFGDFGQFGGVGSRLFYLDANNVINEFAEGDDVLQEMSLFGIGSDNDGELYVLGNTTGTPFGATGSVLRLTPSTIGSEPQPTDNVDSGTGTSVDSGTGTSVDGGTSNVDNDTSEDSEQSGGGSSSSGGFLGGVSLLGLLGLIFLAGVRISRSWIVYKPK